MHVIRAALLDGGMGEHHRGQDGIYLTARSGKVMEGVRYDDSDQKAEVV